MREMGCPECRRLEAEKLPNAHTEPPSPASFHAPTPRDVEAQEKNKKRRGVFTPMGGICFLFCFAILTVAFCLIAWSGIRFTWWLFEWLEKRREGLKNPIEV